MANEKRTCLNCQNLGQDEIRSFFCKQSNLPISVSESCKMFEEKAEPEIKEKRSIRNLNVYFFITLILFFGYLYRYAKNIERKKDFEKSVSEYKEIQKNMLRFDECIKARDTLGFHRYKLVYYTYNPSYPIERFKVQITDNFYKIPDISTRIDTTYVENILLYIHPDTTYSYITVIKGVLIDSYNSRRFKMLQ